MKKLIFINVFLLIFLSQSTNALLNSNEKPELRLAFVHSYSDDSYGTLLQTSGIQSILPELSKKYKIFIKEFYMNSKTKNNTEDAKNEISNIILEKIEKFSPNYIFTTDDSAFHYIGINLSKRGYKILASGINKNFDLYLKEYNIDKSKIILIDEQIKLDTIFYIFSNTFYKQLKWYILYDDNETSIYLMKQYQNELKNKRNYEIKKISNVIDLRYFLQKMQSEQLSVICIALESLYDPDHRKRISEEEIFNEFVKYNKKHIEVVSDPHLVKIGYSISCGPDFENMGKILGNYFMNNINSFKFSEIYPPINISVNRKRLYELNLLDIANKNINLINEIYGNYAK